MTKMANDSDVSTSSSEKERSNRRQKESLSPKSRKKEKSDRSVASQKKNRNSRDSQKSSRLSQSRSSKRHHPKDSKKKKKESMSRNTKRHRSRPYKKKFNARKCSMYATKCPDSVSRKTLMQTAARDRIRREFACVFHMLKEFNMTEVMMWKATERQNAYISMRGLALYLEVVCIVVVAVMGVLAQHLFNTRGNLKYYLGQLTYELFLFFLLVLNAVAPGRGQLTLSFSFSYLDACHTELIIKYDIVMQHCLFKSIPTHYHTIYTSSFLMVLHLATVLISVSVMIFYDGSLDWYLDKASGAKQWITSLPLHKHDEFRSDREHSETESKLERLEANMKSGFSLNDLPDGTSVVREQTECTVQEIEGDNSKKKCVGPQQVTISRSYTVDIPGAKRITGSRSWTTKKPPKSENTSSPTTNKKAAVSKSSSAKFVKTSVDVQSDSRSTTRNPAGKDVVDESSNICISRMPPLMSRVASLKNANLNKKCSEYMY
ncbi:hypothetical protein DICVIV_00022 [Dictyocaulus viviparus]|uniref:Uncharacterized protein n=1 Tax=Dictyocaulus viviparus TaxID=29172 RepID=A0A0D8YC11_DICVI|nr:hypothetical protein DICVIV_00022 [Dictyocaulus viviparus]